MKAKQLFRTMIARQLERRVRGLLQGEGVKVVAVTGSVGKTSTKLAVAAVLRQKYTVLAHPGNYNSEIGLPLSIFEEDVPSSLTSPVLWAKIFRRIDRKLAAGFPYQVVVLEMGADQPGDIQKFMRYIEPDIGIVTAIAPAHIEQFGSVDAVAAEKMSLAAGSQAILLNAEDERVVTEGDTLGEPYQTFGVEQGGVHFEEITRLKSMTLSAKLILNNGDIRVRTTVLGRHNLSALAAAAAVGEELGLSLEEIKTGLESMQPTAGRMRSLPGKHGAVIIDDTYNSSPRAVVAALETLAELPGRHIAILGSMNELGRMSPEAHRGVGKHCGDLDLLVTIGADASKHIMAGAAEAGLSSAKIKPFDSPYDAGRFVSEQLKAGDVVLAKGSQNGVFAEEAIALLLANPDDRHMLVRQGANWNRRKAEQFPVQ